MSTPKDPTDFHGISIKVDGKVLGKIKEWEPQKISPAKLEMPSIDFLPSVGKLGQLPTIPITTGKTWLDVWRNLPFNLRGWCLTQESELLLEVKAQLELWGIELGEPIPNDCLVPILRLLKKLGYSFQFDTEASLDWDFIESLGLGVIKNDNT